MKIILPIGGHDIVPGTQDYLLSLYEVERETLISHIFRYLNKIRRCRIYCRY